MDQRIINLFDEYTHRPLSRKEFMTRLVQLAGSTALAMSALSVLEPGYAQAATVAPNADDLVTEDVSWPGDGATMRGYLVRPKDKKKHGAVVVIHENRGLTPHIKDVTRRVAQAGYLALGVDALSVVGGTPADEDKGREQLIGQLDASKNLNNYLRGLEYLRNRPESNGRTGCVGFCWGGALANRLALADPKLNAAVAYYGTQPKDADLSKVKARLMLHYAGLDERVNAGKDAYEAALKAAGVKYEQYVYEGVNHAFNNDSSPARYNAEAAKLAWERTLRLFRETLS